MSKYVTLTLHLPEETVSYDLAASLIPFPAGSYVNPIDDYFETTGGLVKKIISTAYGNDAEILGLLVLGVVSSAEYYFRRILTELGGICPYCVQLAEGINIPAGSTAFYLQSGLPPTISAFEHESLADSKKITAEIKRFAGLACADSSSVKKALEEFELLCELRHCFVHSRGFVGLKAIRAIGGTRTLQKLLVQQSQALDLIKLSHNAVRAVNHFLSNEVLNRWIDRDVLSGKWVDDKARFNRYWSVFSRQGEDAYSGEAKRAYAVVQPLIVKRQQGIAARVSGAGQ